MSAKSQKSVVADQTTRAVTWESVEVDQTACVNNTGVSGCSANHACYNVGVSRNGLNHMCDNTELEVD